jgi:hypothetical protein
VDASTVIGGPYLPLTAGASYPLTGGLIGTSAEFTQGVSNNVNGLRLLNPGGGSSVGQSSSVTGAIKITLPVSWTNTMMRMTIKVYEYTTNESFTIVCGGYNYSSGTTWINHFAYIESSAKNDRNFTVRFGHDGTKCCVYIGELASSWSYPQVFVTEFEAGYSAYTASTWNNGWVVGFEASAFGTITQTETNTQANNWARNGQNTYFSSGSGNVGIGTTTPVSTLQIVATTTEQITSELTDAGSRKGLLTLSGLNNQVAGAGGGIVFAGNSATSYAAIKGLLNNGGGNTQGSIAFSTRALQADTALTERMRITSAGGISFGSTGTAYGTSGQILKSNANASPTWVDASTVIGGPYLPLTAGSTVPLSGDLYLNNATYIRSTDSNGAVPRIFGINPSNSTYIGPIDAYAGGSIFYGVSANVSAQTFYTGASARMHINSTGNVGIGTTSPGYKLDVAGEVRANNLFRTTDGTNIGLFGSSVFASNVIGIGSSNAVPLVLGTAATERMRIDSSGNVGIGTTSPTHLLTLETASSPGLKIKDTTQGATLLAFSQDSNSHVGTFSSHPLVFDTNSTERMRIDSSGNVGIGTTSPGAKLEVQGYISSSNNLGSPSSGANINMVYGGGIGYITSYDYNNSVYKPLYLRGSTTVLGLSGNVGIGTTSPTNKLDIRQSTSGGSDVLGTGAITIGSDNPYWTFRGTATSLQDLAFDRSYAGTWYESMRIQRSTGNVGIGTTSPNHKLDIYSNENVPLRIHRPSNANLDSSGAWGIGFSTRGDANTSTTDTRAGIFSYYNGNLFLAAANTSIVADPDAYARLTILNAGSIKFNSYNSTNNTGTPTYLLGTDASGNIVKTNTVPGSAAGPYLPLAGGTLSGDLTMDDSDVVFKHTDGFNYYRVGVGTNANFEIYNTNYGRTDLLITQSTGNATFAGSGTFETTLNVIATDSGGSPAMTAVMNMHGYDQRGVGIKMKDNKTTSGGGTDAEWFVGTGYNSTGFNIGYASDGSQSSYPAQAKLSITTSGNATFAGTVTAPTFLGDLNGTINTVTTAVTKANSTNDTTVATTAFVQNLIGTIPAGLVFQGTWNADTNTPTLTSGTGTTGNFYIVSVDGSTNLDGITDWKVGDWAVFVEQGASDQWEKVDNSSVLDGIGTGQTVALWSGSGTSNTLDDSIITQQSPSGVSILSASATTGQNASLSLYGYDTGTSSVKYGNLNIGTDGSFNIGTNDDYIVLNPTNYVKTQAIHIMTDDVFMYRGKHIRFLDGPGDSWNDVLGLTASTDIIQIGAIASFNSNAGEVAFYSANAEKMRLDIDGNFGIGTTSPSTKLHVNGDIGAYTSDWVATVSGSRLLMKTFAGTGDTYSLIQAQDVGGNSNNALVLQPYGDNVGIGTTAPGYKLTVNGDVDVNNGAILAAQPYGINLGVSGYDIVMPTTTRIAIKTEASERISILNTGNVGIGTTSPATALDVNGTISVGGSPIASFSGNYNRISRPNGTVGIYLGNATDAGNYYDNTTHYFRSSGGSSTYAIINYLGNVGIGTTSPGAKLNVAGALGAVVGAGGSAIRLTNTDTGNYSSISAGLVGVINAGMQFSTDGISRMVIDGSGNVGIGTTSPGRKLHVDNSSGVGEAVISGTTGATLYFRPNASYSVAGNFGIFTTGLTSGTYESTMDFKGYYNGVTTPLTIKGSGNVGIGTTSPNRKLHVESSGVIADFKSTTTGTSRTSRHNWNIQTQ